TPVAADSSVKVVSRRRRSARSRGPTASSARSRSSSSCPIRPFCHSRKELCAISGVVCMLTVEVVNVTEELRRHYDAVVIGGGAAGLNGALTLARSRRSVAVIDAGAPRNAPAEGVHGLLGREGMAPAELLERGRAE